MSVRIESISLRHAGPLQEMEFKLGSFNLIYGRNEVGKTFLVEFILRSLFRSLKKWNLRNLPARGRIEVSGLADEIVTFSPSSAKKIEDFWLESNKVLPLDVARLLVVKGAELEFLADMPGGINRTLLREYLSSDALLDTVQLRISKSLQKASLIGYQADGADMGEIKNRKSVSEALAAIDRLFGEVDDAYSEGERQALRVLVRAKEEAIEQQIKARQHRAWQLASGITRLERSRERLSRPRINDLRGLDLKHKEALATIADKERRKKALEGESADYLWIGHAIDEYRERARETGIREKRTFLILAAASVLAAIGCIISSWLGWLGPEWGLSAGLVSILAAMVFTALHLRYQSGLVKRSFDLFQENRISKEYSSRFNVPLASLADMESKKEQLQKSYYEHEGLKEDVEREAAEAAKLELEMASKLAALGIESGGQKPWDEIIRELDDFYENTEKQIQRKQVDLSALNVDPGDYRREDPGVEHSRELAQKLESEKQELERQYQRALDRLDALKQNICRVTGDQISIEWDDLLENLRRTRAEKAAEYRRLGAEIIAKIIVNREIGVIRSRHENEIRAILKSDTLTGPLQQVTRRYQGLDLDGDQLVVSDAYDSYPLSDLSTGAQEQVLLAIRMGCAAKILGRETLFLILDDAFQHADWERREWLVGKMVGLAKSGWQIIYLSMDDHIKELFLKKAADPGLPDSRTIELDQA